MKRSEVLEKYTVSISDAMVDAYRAVIESSGSVQYQIYVWEDGEIERLQGPLGDNSWLKPRDCEPRNLYYVCTVSEPCCDPWSLAGVEVPDDETEREVAWQEVVDWLVREYELTVSDALYEIIEQADLEEMCEE